jgi:hypothetical protein
MDERSGTLAVSGIPYCAERRKLLDALLEAIQQVTVVQEQQMLAVLQGDEDFARFDILLHVVQQGKELAKYRYIAHVEKHGCCT